MCPCGSHRTFLREDVTLSSSRCVTTACQLYVIVVVLLQRFASLRCQELTQRMLSECSRNEQCQGCEVPEVRHGSRDQPRRTKASPSPRGTACMAQVWEQTPIHGMCNVKAIGTVLCQFAACVWKRHCLQRSRRRLKPRSLVRARTVAFVLSDRLE